MSDMQSRPIAASSFLHNEDNHVTVPSPARLSFQEEITKDGC